MNALIQGHSGTAPETSRNALGKNQGTNEDDSQSDHHPEAGIFHNQMTRTFGTEDGQDSSLIQNCHFAGFSLWKLTPCGKDQRETDAFLAEICWSFCFKSNKEGLKVNFFLENQLFERVSAQNAFRLLLDSLICFPTELTYSLALLCDFGVKVFDWYSGYRGTRHVSREPIFVKNTYNPYTKKTFKTSECQQMML